MRGGQKIQKGIGEERKGGGQKGVSEGSNWGQQGGGLKGVNEGSKGGQWGRKRGSKGGKEDK